MATYHRTPLFGVPLSLLLLQLLLAATTVLANVEKIIFTAPAPANIPLAKPSLADLNLHALSPDTLTVRTSLDRVFPVDKGNSSQGHPSWVLLDNLVEGQRYEFHVSWAANEPTLFALDSYELDTVWDTPELIQSLAEHAASRQPANESDDKPPSNESGARKASVLLVHIRAAADYFVDDVELMKNPPPVLVDLVLDPFVLNLANQSLIPTVGYLIIVGVVTWFAARWIASRLQSVAGSSEDQTLKQTKKN
ncbi:hypothetical protein VFPFJ_07100 [Purpureocillium lilacinum]|nr:hypothetical protein VFPFJ_07100 [Purpureocillium lilacinum]OAQ79962.1 hypothetical protein VFPBJ_05547 [Purpureocillium lilacinum]OAQ88635.1 hypothetical protein VFPFJ_07100 [Purpureocillium lilacinum]GJN74225.1 hypothetical protein PLICBS_008316 [Purpureocillium lilacinum]GJN84743.1 hypothetical protein PLIIFM63780_008307 [Purpureocillium lilacinum]